MPVPYRVVQWATGNIGLRALRHVIAHPQLELAGVLVYDPAKEGVDAGTLCGLEPVGVTATIDRSVIAGLDADCVLYMPRFLELDDVVALLESGTNVVTTRGEFFADGERLDADARNRVLDACAKGESSIYATGSSPGFITETLPLALLSMQCEYERLEIEEFANLSRRDSPELLFELMGFGRPLESYSQSRAAYLVGEFGPSLKALAEVAGRPVDDMSAVGEVAAARADTTIVAGEIPAGTIAAQRTTITGWSDGVEVISFAANWYCTPDLDRAWDLLPTGWRVQVRGDAPMDVALTFPVALEDLGGMTPSLTANRPVNAVPYVCRAAPGILAAADVPLVTPTGPTV